MCVCDDDERANFAFDSIVCILVFATVSKQIVLSFTILEYLVFPTKIMHLQSFSFVISIRTHGNISMHIPFIRGLIRLPWCSAHTNTQTHTSKPKGIENKRVTRNIITTLNGFSVAVNWINDDF